MSIIPPAVASTVQLVSGAVATAKTLRDLLKDTQNHELKAAISDLYDDIIDVKARVLDLDEENRNLRAQLEQKDEIVGPFDPFGYFYKKLDDEKQKPICPRCFQSMPSNVVFLGPLHMWNNGQRRSCTVCTYHRLETPMRPGTIRMVPTGSNWG
jgi:hypothetical protein